MKQVVVLFAIGRPPKVTGNKILSQCILLQFEQGSFIIWEILICESFRWIRKVNRQNSEGYDEEIVQPKIGLRFGHRSITTFHFTIPISQFLFYNYNLQLNSLNNSTHLRIQLNSLHNSTHFATAILHSFYNIIHFKLFCSFRYYLRINPFSSSVLFFRKCQ